MSEFVQQPPASMSRPIGEPMEMTASVSAPQGIAEARPFARLLVNPWVDKSVAILAVLPFVYPIAVHFSRNVDVWEFIYLAQTLILIGTMAFRRMAVRISTNPYYWVVAFVATYWGLFVLSVAQRGRPLVASWIVLLLYPFSVFIEIWGRLSLGRNIGMIPAQREIVDRGAYRWVRHPIYTSLFLMVIVGTLRSYSLRNLLLFALAILWCVARTFAEEAFLRKDPAYLAYMKRVRWRWFPGLI